MDDRLSAARVATNAVRFSLDTRGQPTDDPSTLTAHVRDMSLHNDLHINSDVTPGLAQALAGAKDRLGVPGDAVSAFVYASPEVQATCFADGSSNCVIRFSSGLVQLLDEEEVGFVAAHELGHFLLGHTAKPTSADNPDLHELRLQRCQEVSADRIGLIGCGSLKTAASAMMKTLSGLSSRHLRFDVARFLSQLSAGKATPESSHLGSHPSIAVRCRALIWFSMSEVFRDWNAGSSGADVSDVDAKIEADFAKYVDAGLVRALEQARLDFALWMTSRAIEELGVFSKAHQKRFALAFGGEMTDKLVGLLGSASRADARAILTRNTEQARARLNTLVPSGTAAREETRVTVQLRQILDVTVTPGDLT